MNYKDVWVDCVTSNSTRLPIPFLLFSMGCAVVGEYVMIYNLYNLTSLAVMEKIVLLVSILLLLLWPYGGLFLFTVGPSLVRELKINDDCIEIQNGLHLRKRFFLKELSSISLVEEKWPLPKPHYFRVEKKGFTIHLKDGRFFRISPHMERIEELKDKLEQILEENKKSDN